jgi:hypothetical protein
MKKSRPKNYKALLFGVFLIVLAGCGAPPATPTTSGIVISTFTPAPAKSEVPLDVSTPTPASTSEIVGQLPGLSPMNVTVGLEGQQFTCTAVKNVGSHYERTCLKGLPSETLFQVVISGRESFLVDFIQASVRQAKNPDPKIAVEFLTPLAALPYDGATPEDARAWVESTIPALSGEVQEASFGSVKYVLSGPPQTILLEIGELP